MARIETLQGILMVDRLNPRHVFGRGIKPDTVSHTQVFSISQRYVSCTNTKTPTSLGLRVASHVSENNQLNHHSRPKNLTSELGLQKAQTVVKMDPITIITVVSAIVAAVFGGTGPILPSLWRGFKSLYGGVCRSLGIFPLYFLLL